MPQPHALTILRVTQEDQPCDAATDLLQSLGITVRLAKCGRQAVETIRNDGSIDLLVSAMDLSDLDGITLAQLARRHRPGLKVLLLCADLSELRNAARFDLYGLMEPVGAAVLAEVAGDVASFAARMANRAVATIASSPPGWIRHSTAAA